ncbi:hypothetical protein R2A130_1967 [Ahrensia sp. R2A130]|nr:hypothetical protein R2A130_1967 [Ahrensia sp. R2A130]
MLMSSLEIEKFKPRSYRTPELLINMHLREGSGQHAQQG